MKLKHYQELSLDWLRKYYERCRVLQEAGDRFPVATAFTSVTAEIHAGAGLPYNAVPQLPGIPYVCLRIPTGGGKTIVGCEAIPIARKELLRCDHALVLWLVPSDAIRTQTLGRLKNPKDDYRIALETSLGRVEVLDIDEALRVQRHELDAQTSIVVATMQAFRRKDISQLKVYESNGNLMSHFENLPAELLAILEKREDGTFERSLANVFRLRRPYVIIDEAHNSRQPLAFETLKRLNPSAILELTATPNTKRETVEYEGEKIENPPSNVLVSISAYQLKAEEMVKLPIYLRNREPWDELLGDAIAMLNELRDEAEKQRAETGEYLRPVMLLQAQPEYQNRASIHVEQVKQCLVEQFKIPTEEIAIATGDVRGLDGVDVLSPFCRLRFIITVQALKEGWDCPFAYVLFSVAELSSGRAVEQILGRIMRMPHAKRKAREPLNSSYAFVASSNFEHAARALKDGLVEAGFQRIEADDLVQAPELHFGAAVTGVAPTPSPEPVSVVLASGPSAIPVSVVDVVSWDAASKTLKIEQPLDWEQEDALTASFRDEKTREQVREACAHRAGRVVLAPKRLSPSQRGVFFEVPVLALKQGEFFQQFESQHIEDHMQWSLREADASLPEFFIPTERRGIRIDITDEEKLKEEFIPAGDRQLQLLQVSAAWTVGQLVYWLDHSFAHIDIGDAESGIYLTRLIGKLVDVGKFTLEQLTAHRHRLSRAVENKIKQLREVARGVAYEDLLFKEASGPVYVSAAATMKFDPNKYPYQDRYEGIPFDHHYYEVVGAFDSNEECECARIIDSLGDIVEFWVRNLERQPETSFWIQTHTDKFYPDFVCRLKNGKTLVVEYKGGDRATNDDTKEKERLGDLWQARSNGECFFVMAKTPNDFAKVVSVAKSAFTNAPALR